MDGWKLPLTPTTPPRPHKKKVGSDTARQLLGMKGAAETDDLLKIRIQVGEARRLCDSA